MFSLTTLTVLIVVFVFLTGLVLGWIYSRDSELSTKTKVRTAIAIVVTLIWIIAMVADILIVTYTISPLVHAIMGAIVGYFFTEDGLTFNIGGGNK